MSNRSVDARAACFSAALFALGNPIATVVAQELDFSLTPQTVYTTAGGVAVFHGQIKNISNFEIFLNGTYSFVASPPLALDDEPFFDNTPISLQPHDSFTGVLFYVGVDSSALADLYEGFFEIEGGHDGSAFDPLARSQFFVGVAESSVPIAEPVASGLMALMGLWSYYVFRRTRREPATRSTV